MNLLEQERFSRLQFPVHKVTAKSPDELFQILPGLKRYFQRLIPEGEYLVKVKTDKGEEDVKVTGYEAHYKGVFPEDLVKIIKYIVFVYDPDTDLLDSYADDFKALKDAAAKEAGFKRNKDGEWPLYVQDILDFKQKQVVGWILDYLKIKKNPIWQEIKFVEEELDQLYRARANALLKGEVKSDSLRLISERLESKEKLYKRFYAEHSDLKKATEDEIYPVSPENVFKELKIPQEVWKVRQVRDVPKDTGIPEADN